FSRDAFAAPPLRCWPRPQCRAKPPRQLGRRPRSNGKKENFVSRLPFPRPSAASCDGSSQPQRATPMSAAPSAQILVLILFTALVYFCTGLPLAVLPGYVYDDLGYGSALA